MLLVNFNRKSGEPQHLAKPERPGTSHHPDSCRPLPRLIEDDTAAVRSLTRF